jgi:maleate isomerase
VTGEIGEGSVRRIGMLTPSSNTVLEPMTNAMLAGRSDVTVHFVRFRVTEISLRKEALGQFDDAPLLEAARLLADAKVHAIAWNGTSGGWLGLDADRELCRRIEAETGIPATTSTLALAEALALTGARTIGWVTPYLDEIQARIVDTFAAAGFPCRGDRHLRDRGNFSFSLIAPELLAQMARDVAQERPDAIAIFCTNLRAAHLVAALERELRLPIYDTIATALWKSLRLAGVAPSSVRGWGSLFEIG